MDSLVFCIHNSRLSLFCSGHFTLFLRQTDCREPSHSHGYQFVSHNDVINSLPVNFPLYGIACREYRHGSASEPSKMIHV